MSSTRIIFLHNSSKLYLVSYRWIITGIFLLSWQRSIVAASISLSLPVTGKKKLYSCATEVFGYHCIRGSKPEVLIKYWLHAEQQQKNNTKFLVEVKQCWLFSFTLLLLLFCFLLSHMRRVHNLELDMSKI